jgi:glycosyltransferase involved in cell wall biosynthesis
MPGSVSVVIPCYNYGRFLKSSVGSALAQDPIEVSVLVLDDASSDDTPEVGQALAAQDDRVTYRRHSHNVGHISTYNEGLRWASGTYTVLLSADDMLAPGALARAVRVLDTHPDVGMLYGRSMRFIDEPPQIEQPAEQAVRITAGPEWVAARCLQVANPVSCPEVIVRTEVQRLVGGYKHDLPHGADLEMWMRIASRSAIAELVGTIQAFYRIHGANMHTDLYLVPLDDLRELRRVFESLFARPEVVLPSRQRLERLYRRDIADMSLRRCYHSLRRSDLSGARQALRFAASVSSAVPEAESLPVLRGLTPPLCRAAGTWPGRWIANRAARVRRLVLSDARS